MKVIGLCGASGAGKTTLAEGMIAALRARGCRVSVIKHAHSTFDIDHPGKDSHRHRNAGALEVLVANAHRMALMREFEAPADLNVHDLMAQLADLGDDHWVLLEGFKHADLLKIEVWRAAQAVDLQMLHDPFIVAVASPDLLPVETALPVLPLTDPTAVVAFLMQDPLRYAYAARA